MKTTTNAIKQASRKGEFNNTTYCESEPYHDDWKTVKGLKIQLWYDIIIIVRIASKQVQHDSKTIQLLQNTVM